MNRIPAVAALVLLAALTGCSGSDDPSDADASASAGPPRTTSCTLDDRDGTTVKLSHAGDELTATFEGTEVPDTGTAVYVVNLYPDAGDEGAQLGMKFQDGDPVAYYYFDTATYKQFSIRDEPEVDGDTVEGTFHLDQTASIARWSAAVTIDGGRDAVCPVDDKPLRFPG